MTVKPHHAASHDSLSRWAISALHLTNEDWPSLLGDDATCRHIRACDIWAVSTSWAFFRDVPMAEICKAAKAACWQTPSTFTTCYLSDVLRRDGAHGTAILALASAAPSLACLHLIRISHLVES